MDQPYDVSNFQHRTSSCTFAQIKATKEHFPSCHINELDIMWWNSPILQLEVNLFARIVSSDSSSIKKVGMMMTVRSWHTNITRSKSGREKRISSFPISAVRFNRNKNHNFITISLFLSQFLIWNSSENLENQKDHSKIAG